MAALDSREARRELVIDTMASWALEDMEPTPEMVQDIGLYVEGKISTAEIIEKVKRGGYRD
ncbi:MULTISPECIES: antitoxin VbhA family protein [Microbacterium]|uniref:antitoxin VbhA family protein n=1 Tax=Microbacterium TaxID=33882 RepID=UPI0023DCB3F1|nr:MULTISPECIES: antitoxin VbhA family protein [Microbacterium]MDF2047919.1 antitoxin VbhA family protein [Microbacterium sp. Kw_RZR3]MDF2919648.1 hypothetical protein [Microbacterium sp.]MDQ1074471.1 hypothetical protein [Microbacterium sp. SORGH_AS_0969]MDQ1114700.1 hypothetical protein [Microbacterium testaceum]